MRIVDKSIQDRLRPWLPTGRRRQDGLEADSTLWLPMIERKRPKGEEEELTKPSILSILGVFKKLFSLEFFWPTLVRKNCW